MVGRVGGQPNGCGRGDADGLAAAAEATRLVASWPDAERSDAQREACRLMGIDDAAPHPADADLTKMLPANVAFHGVGVVSENSIDLDIHPRVHRPDATTGSEDYQPRATARVKIRRAHFYDRDGYRWELTRHSHASGIDIPRYCLVRPPGEDSPADVTVHALSRVCNAMAGNAVPIVPLSDHDGAERPVPRPRES